MYIKINYEDIIDESREEYFSKEEVIKDANRYFHEYFFKDGDYDVNFKIKNFEEALVFWEANGYKIILTMD